MNQSNVIPGIVVSLSLTVLGCDGIGQDGSEPRSGVQGQNLQKHFDQAAAGKAAARTKLEGILPQWDGESLLQEPSLVLRGPDLALPRDLARRFTTADLSFAEKRANGRDVFKDGAGGIILKVKAPAGVWELLQPRRLLASGKAPYAKETALEETHRIFDAMGLPGVQKAWIVNDEIIIGAPDGTETSSGRHVRIHRRVNGLRVHGSRFMVTFDLTGQAYRIESRWPDFRITGASSLHTREEAIDALSDLLSTQFADQSAIGNVETELAYHPKPDGTFEPIVSAAVFSTGHDILGTAEYSLVNGVVDGSSDSSGVDG